MIILLLLISSIIMIIRNGIITNEHDLCHKLDNIFLYDNLQNIFEFIGLGNKINKQMILNIKYHRLIICSI
jgi:DNA gyrase/topoisomerase IV subunit B